MLERRLSMARIDADRRQPLGAKRMIEPYRQRSGLEHYAFHSWRPLADKLGDDARIRCALATPDPFTCSADRDCRLFIDTSRPIYSSMAVLHSMLGPGVQS